MSDADELPKVVRLQRETRLWGLLPSYDAYEGFEYVRRSGKFNMITDYTSVVDFLTKIGAFETITWFYKCAEEKVSWWSVYERWLDYCRENYESKPEFLSAAS